MTSSDPASTLLIFLRSLLYGILEGITEWLPVSSTGHLILLGQFLRLDVSPDPVFNAEFAELFEVLIQLGAIAAVALVYRRRLFGDLLVPTQRKKGVRLWSLIILATIPAALAGTVIDRLTEAVTGKDIHDLLFTPQVVSAALIVWGIFFIAAEKRRVPGDLLVSTENITPGTAMKIGIFQTFSLIPGTSRSGSTVLGGILSGLDRSTAAEFSFFMAIPVMAGAGLIKLVGFFDYLSVSGAQIPANALISLTVGTLTSFLVSLPVIRFLTDLVKKHSFIPFAVYRIILGAAVLVYSELF